MPPPVDPGCLFWYVGWFAQLSVLAPSPDIALVSMGMPLVAQPGDASHRLSSRWAGWREPCTALSRTTDAHPSSRCAHPGLWKLLPQLVSGKVCFARVLGNRPLWIPRAPFPRAFTADCAVWSPPSRLLCLLAECVMFCGLCCSVTSACPF